MNIDEIVDHLVYATPDVKAGVSRITALLGVEPVAGGQHPGRGTRNALVSLGPRTYLEIVGPDPDQPTPGAPRWFRIDELSEPKLVTWATAERDISSLAKRAALAGISLGAIAEGRRARGDGVTLSWRFTDPALEVCDGIVPFLIDWGQSPHPATMSPAGGQLVALRARHPHENEVRRILNALGRDLVVEHGKEPTLIATIRTSRGEVELR